MRQAKRSHTVRFAGMTEKESAPLLNFLKEHATQPGLTCRFRWDVGSLAIWDNRCTQHIALNDYQGQRRVMHRITVAGDKPSVRGGHVGWARALKAPCPRVQPAMLFSQQC